MLHLEFIIHYFVFLLLESIALGDSGTISMGLKVFKQIVFALRLLAQNYL